MKKSVTEDGWEGLKRVEEGRGVVKERGEVEEGWMMMLQEGRGRGEGEGGCGSGGGGGGEEGGSGEGIGVGEMRRDSGVASASIMPCCWEMIELSGPSSVDSLC